MPTDAHTAPQGLRATALSLEDLSKLLSKSAVKSITVDMLRHDTDTGAPTNADGTVNVVHYAAWLVKELAGHGN